MRSIAYRLALVFIFTVPWEAGVQIPEIGRGSRFVGFLVGLVWLASVVERGRLRQPHVFHKAFFLFMVWSGLTFFWSVDTDATMGGFLTEAQLFILTLILWDLLDTRARIETALQAYVLGAYVTCASIIWNYLTAPEVKFPEHERVNALGFETDGVALIVAIAGPAAWYLAAGPTSAQRPRVLRRLSYAYLPIGLWALVLTGTRGATLASIPTALFVLWSLRTLGDRTRAVVAIAALVALVGVIWFAPQGQLNRLQTTVTATELGQEGGALSGRWPIWKASVDVFSGRPVGGVGLDAHRAAVAAALGQDRTFRKSEKEAHNAYLSVLAETGIVGFVLFLSLIIAVVAELQRLRGWDLWYWSAQLGVLAIGAVSLSIEDRKSVWMLLVLAVSYAAATEPAAVTARSAGLGRAPQLSTARLHSR